MAGTNFPSGLHVGTAPVVADPAAMTVGDPAAITATTPPAGGTGATAGAYDTSAHRDAMITSLTAVIADVTATRAEVVKAHADIDVLRATVLALTNALQAAGLISAT